MHRHGQLQLAIFNDPFFGENGMLLRVDGRPECWLIDPGLPPQAAEMIAAIERLTLTPAAILLTHCHADHIAGIEELRETFAGLPILCPRGEELLLTDPVANLSAAMGVPIAGPPPDRLIAAGDRLELATSAWTALDVSGHSPGGLGYYASEPGVLLVGDAVFAEGIGRTDLPHSDHERLLRNIRNSILTLPPETIVYPGHGDPATVHHLRHNNHYLRELLGLA